MTNLSLHIGNTAFQYNPITPLVDTNLAKNSEQTIRIFWGDVNRDQAVFSTIGKKLNLIVNDKDAIQWNTVLSGSQNKNLNTADEYISRAGALLEQMLKITEVAKDASLSVEERLAMQTEIGRLQHELNIIGETLFLAPGLGERDYAPQEDLARSRLGPYENSLSYRMLRRAADRVANGGEWNVREVVHPGVWSKNEDGLVEDINGVINGVYENYFGSSSMTISYNEQYHGTLSDKVGHIYEVTEDARAPTVGEILKNTGRSIMNTTSAAETAETLKRDLAKLEEQQIKLAELAQSENGQPSYTEDAFRSNAGDFLRKVADILQSLYRDSYQETVDWTALYSRNLAHNSHNAPAFSAASEEGDSLFKNKNLPEFAPSTVMGTNVKINNKTIND